MLTASHRSLCSAVTDAGLSGLQRRSQYVSRVAGDYAAWANPAPQGAAFLCACPGTDTALCFSPSRQSSTVTVLLCCWPPVQALSPYQSAPVKALSLCSPPARMPRKQSADENHSKCNSQRHLPEAMQDLEAPLHAWQPCWIRRHCSSCTSEAPDCHSSLTGFTGTAAAALQRPLTATAASLDSQALQQLHFRGPRPPQH